MEPRATDTLIVGFGMAAIPVIRELEKSGKDFVIISANTNIWRRMEDNKKLNFDLVSTKFSTYFSWDLLDLKKDYFPTAQEFYDYQKSYYEKYKDKIHKDVVTKIENFADFSLIQTSGGKTYKASNVVVATGFKRKIAKDIVSFDTSVKNKTIILNAIGDTTNLFVSDLIAGNNKIYIVCNGGLTMLNKTHISKRHHWRVGGSQHKTGGEYTLDQFEFQNLGFYSKSIYEDMIGFSSGSVLFMNGISFKSLIQIWRNKKINLTEKTFAIYEVFSKNCKLLLAKVISRNSFHIKHRTGRDRVINRATKMPSLDASPFIKYWTIESYQELFGSSIKDSLRQGYKLNDIAFFIEEGLVNALYKPEVEIDKDAKFIIHKGKVISYDFLIEGDIESPNFLDIEIIDQNKKPYEHVYRECYLGVIPKNLNNLYFTGITRPNTGGIGNITEMQSLLIHKMITNAKFRKDTLDNLAGNQKEYDLKYYWHDEPSPIDHIVYYGFYNEEVARVIGIDLKTNLFSSFFKFDVLSSFVIPNNTSRYRMQGEYKIPKLSKTYRNIINQYAFEDVSRSLVTYLNYRLIYFSLTLLSIFHGYISWPIGLVAISLQLVFSNVFLIFFENSRVSKHIFSILWLISIPFIPLSWNLPIIIADLLSIPILRKFGGSMIFNDIANTKKYRDFFYNQYLPELKSLLHNK